MWNLEIINCKEGSWRKCSRTNDIQQKIENILSDHNDLGVNRIKDELGKQGVGKD